MAGRPTKMCERYVEMIGEYLETCHDDYEVLEKSWSSGERSESKTVENKFMVKLPTFVGLLIYFDDNGFELSEETLHVWKKKGENSKDKDDLFYKFSESLKKIMRKQQEMLLNGATSGRYNPIISKMLLNVNHGYKEVEKKEVSIEGNIKLGEIKELSTEELLKQIESEKEE